METTFFGLYGVSSPLPGYYTEELFDDDWDEEQAARGFLDIIHYSLYPLLYKAWLKYRFNLNAVEQNNKEYWEIIFSLIGLSAEFRDQFSNPGELLKYTGIISQHPKSQLGLQTMLSDMLKDIPARVVPCISRQVKIMPQQQCKLGQSKLKLGEDVVIGEFVNDRSGKFRIQLGPVGLAQFQVLSSDATLLKRIRQIVNIFLVKPLLYDVELLLESGVEQSVRLDQDSHPRLGINTWVGSSSTQQQYSLILN